jgi:hypothetical protein
MVFTWVDLSLRVLLLLLGPLLNGRPHSALFCSRFARFSGWFFHFLLVPSAYAVIAVHMKREQRHATARWSKPSTAVARRRGSAPKGAGPAGR